MPERLLPNSMFINVPPACEPVLLADDPAPALESKFIIWLRKPEAPALLARVASMAVAPVVNACCTESVDSPRFEANPRTTSGEMRSFRESSNELIGFPPDGKTIGNAGCSTGPVALRKRKFQGPEVWSRLAGATNLAQRFQRRSARQFGDSTPETAAAQSNRQSSHGVRPIRRKEHARSTTSFGGGNVRGNVRGRDSTVPQSPNRRRDAGADNCQVLVTPAFIFLKTRHYSCLHSSVIFRSIDRLS